MHTQFTVQKNIPIPSCGMGCPKTKEREALESIEVGDSIFFPKEQSRKARGALKNINGQKKKAQKFTSRKVTEDGVDGYRIWRIA